jgi:hypothetical protein
MESAMRMIRTRMHTNRFSPAESACDYCRGVFRHAKWCRTRNKRVQYAYDITLHPERMTLEDILALRGMSVAWSNNILDCEKAVNG